jgi:hypothetical protein
MRYANVILLLAVILVPRLAIGESPRFHSTRAVEFHLAEQEPGPGLLPVHVLNEARIVYLHPNIELDERDIKRASVVKGPLGEPAVQVLLKPTGVKKMTVLTQKNQHKMLAIVANDRAISVPWIMGEMIDDLLDITGSFTRDEAEALVRVLNQKIQEDHVNLRRSRAVQFAVITPMWTPPTDPSGRGAAKASTGV